MKADKIIKVELLMYQMSIEKKQGFKNQNSKGIESQVILNSFSLKQDSISEQNIREYIQKNFKNMGMTRDTLGDLTVKVVAKYEHNISNPVGTFSVNIEKDKVTVKAL